MSDLERNFPSSSDNWYIRGRFRMPY